MIDIAELEFDSEGKAIPVEICKDGEYIGDIVACVNEWVFEPDDSEQEAIELSTLDDYDASLGLLRGYLSDYTTF